MTISISITESSTNVLASNVATTIKAYNQAIPLATQTASTITSTAYGPITATNIQDAINQLADQNFRQAAAPTGATVSEGDTWYDTDDDEFKVYRETSTGVYQWAPIMLGTPPGDSDIVDAGAF
jgi:hypothetical protein|tara:strand:- start:471 stop:842 length:372 start_codon:yes stop_codon:yes gene_type:complete